MSTARASGKARFLVGHSERVQAGPGSVGYGVDLGVGTFAGDVARPSGEHVAKAVELPGDTEQLDEMGVIRVDGTAPDGGPERGAVTAKHAGLLGQCELGVPDDVEEIVDPLGLRLGIADERGPHAPVLEARTLREVDETGEVSRLDVGGHASSVRGRSRMTYTWLLTLWSR